MQRYFRVFHSEGSATVVGEDRAQHMSAQLHHMGKTGIGYVELSRDEYVDKVHAALKAAGVR